MPQLDDLIALALNAGREIMAVRAAGFDTQSKGDGSPVTLADQRAEQIIEGGLARLAPGIPMIGEEAVSSGRIPAIGACFYCVDPLDGTRGFAKGGDEFTVNIAWIEDGVANAGVVFAPATGELYAGEPGRALSALCNVTTSQPRGQPKRIKAQAKPPDQWRIVASDFSGRNEKTADFIAKLDGAITHASSSIKLCRIAEGRADLYPRFGDISEWDIAAGHAILAAAGGGLMRLDGSAMRYGDRDGGFLVRGFVAYASAAAEAAARDALGL